MIASQYFLLDKQLKMAFMYNCHTEGGNIESHWHSLVHVQGTTKYGSIPQYILELSVNLSEWNASFKSSTNSTSHLEPPNNMNVSFNKG